MMTLHLVGVHRHKEVSLPLKKTIIRLSKNGPNRQITETNHNCVTVQILTWQTIRLQTCFLEAIG